MLDKLYFFSKTLWRLHNLPKPRFIFNQNLLQPPGKPENFHRLYQVCNVKWAVWVLLLKDVGENIVHANGVDHSILFRTGSNIYLLVNESSALCELKLSLY